MQQAAGRRSFVRSPVILVIGAIGVGYVLATWAGWTVPSAAGDHHEHAAEVTGVAHFWAVIPFALLLGAIAILPLPERTAEWWEHNLHKFYVAGTLALVTLLYLAVLHPDAFDRVRVVFRVVGHVPHPPAQARVALDRARAVELCSLVPEPGVFGHQVEAQQQVGDRPGEQQIPEARDRDPRQVEPGTGQSNGAH